MVSQLALAHERQLIEKGCSLHLTVLHAKDDLTKKQKETDEGKEENVVPVIKLQMKKSGSKHQETLELDEHSAAKDFAAWDLAFSVWL